VTARRALLLAILATGATVRRAAWAGRPVLCAAVASGPRLTPVVALTTTIVITVAEPAITAILAIPSALPARTVAAAAERPSVVAVTT
jgi:hypothetical protein